MLDEGGWLTARRDLFTPGKGTRYPLYRKLGGSQGRYRRVPKKSSPMEFDPRIVQQHYWLSGLVHDGLIGQRGVPCVTHVFRGWDADSPSA